MKTKTNRKRHFSLDRSASQIVKALSIGALTMASLGCQAGVDIRPKRPTFEAQASFGGAAAAEAELDSSSAPASQEAASDASFVPSSYAQSGGGSVETAEFTSSGNTIAGRVAKGADRFYAIDLAVGDALSFKLYSRQLTKKSADLSATLLEPDMVKLSGADEYLYHGTDALERMTFEATASQAGRHYIRVNSDAPAEYRIEITALSMAAR